jgi:hypothetical protein
MQSIYMLSMGLLVFPFGLAGAQRADTTGAKADSLRHQIEARFASKAQELLGLTNDQTAKLRATSQQFGARRSELRTRGDRLREALAGQLRPGVAANQDSVAKLTDAMLDLRIAQAQVARDEIKEQSRYLNPVQRAQLYVMRERFTHRIKEVRGHRWDMPGRHRGGHWDDVKEHTPGEHQRSTERQRTPPESSGRI